MSDVVSASTFAQFQHAVGEQLRRIEERLDRVYGSVHEENGEPSLRSRAREHEKRLSRVETSVDAIHDRLDYAGIPRADLIRKAGDTIEQRQKAKKPLLQFSGRFNSVREVLMGAAVFLILINAVFGVNAQEAFGWILKLLAGSSG